MCAKQNHSVDQQTMRKEPTGMNRINVVGFKSLATESSIDIKPLTILAAPTIPEKAASCSRSFS